MTKLIASALLSFGIAAAAMAADMPKSAAPIAVRQPPAASSSPLAPKSTKKHSGKKGKKSTPAPSKQVTSSIQRPGRSSCRPGRFD